MISVSFQGNIMGFSLLFMVSSGRIEKSCTTGGIRWNGDYPMNSTGNNKKNVLKKSWLFTHINCCMLNMGPLFIFECIYFFIGYFAVYRLSETLFFDIVSLRGFTLVEAGDLSIILNDWQCLIAAIIVLLCFSFFLAVECAAVILTCQASRRGEKMAVFALFKLSATKALKILLPWNWPFLLHGLLLFPIFNFGFVFKAISEWNVSSILASVFDFSYGRLIAAAVLLCVVIIGILFVFVYHFFVLNGDSYFTAVKKSVMMVRGRVIKTGFYLTGAVLAPYLILVLVLVPIGIIFYRLFGAEIVNMVFERAAHADLNAFFTDAQNRLSVLSMVFAALSSAMITTALSLMNMPVFLITVDAAFYNNGGENYVKRTTNPTGSGHYANKKRQNDIGYYVVTGILLAVFVSYQAYGLLNLMFWGSTNTVGRLMVAAHRGDTAKAPENTKAAILKAIETGADCVEVDVVETKDGVLILCHDLNLKRICGIKKDVGTMTYRELKTLDIGSHDNRAFSGERFLTLDEAMTLCDGKIKMNIELKPSKHDHELAEKAVDIFHNHFFYQKGFISSLNEKILIRVEALDPMITTCLDMFVPAQKARLCPVDIYSVKAEYLTDDLFNILEKNGKQCWAWTVNDEQNMTKLIDKGIAGIVTDHSEQALVLAKTRQVRDADFMKRAFFQSLFHIY